MPLLMIRNDITKMKVDAIVNPANVDLLEGSGTSYAIYNAAGEELLKAACAKHGKCKVGSSVITEGFNLCKYIIHTVGPVYDDGYSGECETLELAYHSALNLAWNHDCRDVAFPLLSAGNYGFPKDLALDIAVTAIKDFLKNHDMFIYLVLYDAEATTYAKKQTPGLTEYISDQYVEENNEDLAGDEFYREFLQYQLQQRRQNRGQGYIESEEPYFVGNNSCAGDSSVRRRIREALDEEVQYQEVLYKDTQCKEDKTVLDFSDECEFPEDMSMPLASANFFKPEKSTKKRRLEDYMKGKKETFQEMLIRLINESGMKNPEIYFRANMTKQLFSKITTKKDYTPKKQTILSLALALELSLDDTIDLLSKAGYAFSDCSKTDIIIRYYIENGEYDIFEINETLFHYHLDLLG